MQSNSSTLFRMSLRSTILLFVFPAFFSTMTGRAGEITAQQSRPPVSAAAGPVAGQAPIRFDGYVLSEGKPLFNLSDVNDRWFGWFELNMPRHGVTVTAYDPIAMTVTLREEGSSKSITVKFSPGTTALVQTKPVFSLIPEKSESLAKVPSLSENEVKTLMQVPPVELPPAVRAMMFPTDGAKRNTVLSHPLEAAPFLEDSSATIPPDVARYFPAKPGPLWEHPDPARRSKTPEL